jgi:hypothetical protein
VQPVTVSTEADLLRLKRIAKAPRSAAAMEVKQEIH